MFVCSLVALALVSLVSSSAVPLTKCKAEDANCIKQNSDVLVPLFTAGIPELGVEQLDPVFFKKIDSSNNLLKLIFRDATLKGLSSCKFKSLKQCSMVVPTIAITVNCPFVDTIAKEIRFIDGSQFDEGFSSQNAPKTYFFNRRDAAKMLISAKTYCDVTLDGKYEMKGTILGLPINGDGKMHIEHEKVEITFALSYKEETGPDGKKHWTTGDWDHSFAYKGKTKMEFDNLFGGNEILGRAARELMKNSANDIASITAGPVIKTITGRILKNVKIFFEKIPVEEFALD